MHRLMIIAVLAVMATAWGVLPSFYCSYADVNDPAAGIGDVSYETLQEALDAAADGDTVVLLRDVKENVRVMDNDSTDSLTIDLGGHTMRPSDPKTSVIFVNGGGEFTLKNGKVSGFNSDEYGVGAVHVFSETGNIEVI